MVTLTLNHECRVHLPMTIDTIDTQTRLCAYIRCGKPLSRARAANPIVKYCDNNNHCRMNAAGLKQRTRDKIGASSAKLKEAGLESGSRRGQVYDELLARPDLIEKYRLGELYENDLAITLGYERSSISRALVQIGLDEVTIAERAKWPGPPEEAVAALESFTKFRDRYFLTEKGIKFVTEPYHARWITALLKAMKNGERLMILSPPKAWEDPAAHSLLCVADRQGPPYTNRLDRRQQGVVPGLDRQHPIRV